MNHISVVLLGLVVAVTACENRSATAATAASASSALTAIEPGTAAKPANQVGQVERIVFIGKEHACDCTKKKIETATAALKKLLGEPSRVPIETFAIDVEPDRAEPYRQMRPIMAVPAIYLLDGKGRLVEMLQGEVTEAQLSQALGKQP